MKLLVGFLALLSFALPASAADAAPATPDAIVTEMYQTYYDALNAGDVSGATENLPNCVDQTAKYATPELAARLKKTESVDDPVIDFDFLVNGQDYKDLKLISAKVKSETADAATVRVESQNFDTKSVTDVLLKKTAAGWKVADLILGPGEAETISLDAILKEGGL